MSRLLLLATLALAGCLSPGVSDPTQTFEFSAPRRASDIRVTVALPSALRRPTLVTRDGDRVVNHDMARWGSPLGPALAREIASDLADLPVQDVVIEVQRLDVTLEGKVTLIFRAELTLGKGTDSAGAPLRVQAGPIEHRIRLLGTPLTPLSAAFFAYRTTANLMGEAIRSAVAEEQGEIAKPSAGVTVPGK